MKLKVRKAAKNRKRYNQVPHLTGQDTTWERNKNTINITNKSQEVSRFPAGDHKAPMNRRDSMRNTRHKVSKGAKIRNRYNQAPHPTQDTNGGGDKLTLDTTNESQEVSPFPAGDHNAHINRRAQRHSKHKTEQKHKRSTKEGPPWNGQ